MYNVGITLCIELLCIDVHDIKRVILYAFISSKFPFYKYLLQNL